MSEGQIGGEGGFEGESEVFSPLQSPPEIILETSTAGPLSTSPPCRPFHSLCLRPWSGMRRVRNEAEKLPC